MIEWIEQAEFWNRFESLYQPADRYLDGRSWFERKLELLSSAIPIAPVRQSAEESDVPGPCVRWYGCIDEHLIVVSWHEQESDLVEVSFEPDGPAGPLAGAALRELFGVEVASE